MSPRDSIPVPNTIIYDDTEPICELQMIIWVDGDGNTVETVARNVPPPLTALALHHKSSTAAVRGLSTQTLTVPATEDCTTEIALEVVSGNRSSAVAVPTEPPQSEPHVPSRNTSVKPEPAPPLSFSVQKPTRRPRPSVDIPKKPPMGLPSSGPWISEDAPPSGRFGISYAPYRASHECKTKQDIEQDFQRFASNYSVVRIYGTDCDQVRNVYSAAKTYGIRVFLGIWEPTAVEDEVGKIVSGVNGDWNLIHTISVGNELVNNGQASPGQVIKAVKSARSSLRAAGYQGPVVAVDTFVAVQAHPELCEESDYCAVNAHAFFDSTCSASDAGEWLQNTVSNVKSALSVPKMIVVTETGWPTKGDRNGMAIPGLENQEAALDSIKREFVDSPGNVILFSAFNDLWKQKSLATFNADQYWGIGGAVSTSDE